MKYMFISQTLSQGGAERVISVISSALSEQGSDVIVVKYFSTDGEYEIGDKVNIVNLSGGDISVYRQKNKIQLIRSLRHVIKEQNPDCVIPFTYPVAQQTEIASLGMHINVFQSIRINPALGPSRKWMRFLRDRLVYRSKCTFVQNNQQKQYFKTRFHSRIHILCNPVSEELFSVAPKAPNEEFIICALGRLTDQKNYPLLIDAFTDAFSNLPSVKLRIYGEGTKREILQACIDEHGMSSRIQIMGRSNDVKAVFQDADIYVMSSDWEGMPNALIEAMACHVFSISTDCPTGPSDLIRDSQNGLLVPVGDRAALKEALLKAYSMPYKERMLMSAQGRETIERKCSSHTIAREMDDICKSAIKRN